MKKIKVDADLYERLKAHHDYYKDRYEKYFNKYDETSTELATCKKELEIYKNLIKTVDIKDTEMVFYKGKAYRIKSSILTHDKGYLETLNLICNEVNEVGVITIEK